jgi:hypothetical protein
MTAEVLDIRQRYDARPFLPSTAIQLAEAEKSLGDVNNLTGLVGVATAIVFLLWIYRASRNLHSLGALGQRFSPGWAVGWWFIPIMFFFRPYQVMVEIWKGSTPRATREATFDWKAESVSTLLPWWWACWIAQFFAAFVWGFAEESGGTNIVWQASLLVDATGICGAVLAIAVVWRTTQHQDEKNQKMIG